jgi:hypothetical protein
MDDGLSRAMMEWLGSFHEILSVQPLPGDASTRKYYRIVTSGAPTYILMKMAPFEVSSLSFLSVQRYLQQVGVRVPQVFEMNPSLGLLLLEDLGDITLLKRLQTASSQEEKGIYEGVLDLLVEFQKRTFSKPAHALEAFSLRFDREKLMWEVKFTWDHFYKKYLKKEISLQEEQSCFQAFDHICTVLSEEPVVLTHRDFHSRNIMFVQDHWAMIDFQDARLGPLQYDLASLLRDSYYQMSDEQGESLVHSYRSKCQELDQKVSDPLHFLYIFDLMSIQRNFKAIGSFASFMNLRGDPGYLKYIGNTFEMMRKTLWKYPEFAALREVLFRYYHFL